MYIKTEAGMTLKSGGFLKTLENRVMKKGEKGGRLLFVSGLLINKVKFGVDIHANLQV